jgi:hypothetical protein
MIFFYHVKKINNINYVYVGLSNRNGLPILLIDYDIDNRLIGKNLLLTIRTILSNNDINIEVFKHYFLVNHIIVAHLT